MSYNSSTGLIEAPVSIKDVCDALNIVYDSSYADVGYLCKRASRLNPTARFKPFKGGGVEVQTNLWDFGGGTAPTGWAQGDEYDFDNQGLGHWSPRAQAAFGTLLPQLTFDDYTFPNPGAKWTCSTPTGGTSEPYRLSDFNGYQVTPKNVWSFSLTYPPHFAIYQRSTTPAGQYARFGVSILTYTQALGAPDSQYVSLKDVARGTTNHTNESLYIWVAVMAEAENSRTGGKVLYAKRTTQTLAQIFNNQQYAVEVDFNLNENFHPWDTSSGSFITGQSLLYNIKGPFKIQCFIGPQINSDGFVSSQYNGLTQQGIAGHGSDALSASAASCLSLSGVTLGSDITNIDYNIVNWNTGISFETTPGTITYTKDSSNYYHYNVTSQPSVKIKRASVSGNYDTISTIVYYKITALLSTSGSYYYMVNDEPHYINGGETITLSSGNSWNVSVGGQTQSITAQLPSLIGMEENVHHQGSWTITISTSDTDSGYGTPSTSWTTTIP